MSLGIWLFEMPKERQLTQLHLISDLAQGGASSQLRLLAEQAVRYGDTVHVVSLRSAINRPIAKRLRVAGVSVHSIGKRFSVDPIAIIRLGKFLRKFRPDAIQTWDTPSAKVVSAARQLGMRIGWFHTVREREEEPKTQSIIPKLTRLSNHVVVSTGAIKAELVELGIPPQKLKVVPNGWEYGAEADDSDAIGSIEADQIAVRDSLGLSPDAKLIVTALCMDSAQRLKEAIWAADLVRVLHPSVRFYVLGDGPARMQCERFAEKATAAGTVRFLGYREDLSKWLAAADVVWCLTGSSGASTPLLEAMSHARPVIAAKCQEHKHLIQDGQTGWLVDWRDRAGWTKATDRLLNDAKLAARIGTAGQLAIADYSADRVAAMHRACLLDSLQFSSDLKQA